MIDPNYIYENEELIKQKYSEKGYDFDYKYFSRVFKGRKKVIQDLENLRKKQNDFNKMISDEKRKPNETELAKIKELSSEIKNIEELRRNADGLFRVLMLQYPNIQDDSVPSGKSSKDNVLVKEVGKIREFDFAISDHTQIGKNLNLFDLEVAAKITGSRFNLYKGLGAKLERALINFMLDEHGKKGYEEIFPPFICNENSFVGTGNLPKFEEDLFKIEGTKNYLIVD